MPRRSNSRGRCSKAAPSRGVAVRSSALDEDGHDASFAGQHATYLNVWGVDAVLTAIEGVWRSAHGLTALAYRRDRGLAKHAPSVAVLVQGLVSGDASGVAFSVAHDAEGLLFGAADGFGGNPTAVRHPHGEHRGSRHHGDQDVD